jgi:hypothetical protein
MARIVPSVLAHLLEDQHDAIGAASLLDGPGGSGISDPTPRMAGLLAPFTAHERNIASALNGIAKSYDHLERVCQAAVKGQAPANTEPRCPGWNEELRDRLGGCGKVLESYRLANGSHQLRSTGLCVGCRRASEREARMRENAA